MIKKSDKKVAEQRGSEGTGEKLYTLRDLGSRRWSGWGQWYRSIGKVEHVESGCRVVKSAVVEVADAIQGLAQH